MLKELLRAWVGSTYHYLHSHSQSSLHGLYHWFHSQEPIEAYFGDYHRGWSAPGTTRGTQTILVTCQSGPSPAAP